MSFARYDWFEEWKDGKVTNRGPDYKGLKEAFIQSVLDVVIQIYPKIKDRVCARVHLFQLQYSMLPYSETGLA